MVAIRHLTIQAPRLDGATLPDSSTSWDRRWSDVNQHVLNRLVSTVPIGRFTPAMLGRRPEGHSLVRVWADAVAPGDGVFVRGSSSNTEADPPDVLRRALTETTTSIESAAVIELAPYDDLCIVGSADGDVATVHVTVTEFSAEEYLHWLGVKFSAGNGQSCCTHQTREIAGGDTTLDTWLGRLFVHATMDGGAVVTLPGSDDLQVGSTVVIERTTNSAWFRVVAAAGDTINDAASPIGIDFKHPHQGEMFVLSSQGRWLSTGYGVSLIGQADNNVAGGTVLLDAWAGDYTILVNFSEHGDLVLPPLADVAFGQRLTLARLDGGGEAQVRIIASTPGSESLNGQNNASAWLEGRGAVVVVTRVPGGWSVATSHELAQLAPAQAVAAAGTLPRWAGDQLVTLAIAAGGTVLLPPLDAIPPGSRAWVARTGGTGAHRLEAQPGDDFNGASGGGVNLVLGAPPLEVVHDGSGWRTVGLPPVADETVTIAANTTITETWHGLRAFTITAAVVLTLPRAPHAIGTQALVRPAIAGASVDGNGSNISYAGSLAGSASLTLDEPVLLVWNGTEWAGV